MEKYGTYKVYYCEERKEYIQVPHSNEEQALEKYARQGLTLVEVKDNDRRNKVQIVQPG